MKKWMVALAIALLGSSAATAAELPTAPVSVSGTILAAPCKINNSQPIAVEFGDVVIQSVDGVHYERDVPTSITCDKFTGELLFAIQATSSTFDSDAAASNINNLAIRFTLDSHVVTLNEQNKIDWRKPLGLKAVPVINPEATPAAGEFKVNATLVLDVQ